MPPVDIAELERLARAATPGPWFDIEFDYRVTGGKSEFHVSCSWPDFIAVCWMENALTATDKEKHSNAAYIAAAHPQAILRLCEEMRAIRALVDEQANDDGIWFIAQTGPEAYLQQELRRLHALIEGVTPDDCARSLLARAGEEK